MTTFLIQYKNKIIGSYQDYEAAELFILSCLQNNLMVGSAKILRYKSNSCYCDNEYTISLPSNKKAVNFIPAPVFIPATEKKKEQHQIAIQSINMNDPKLLEIAKSKLELQHNINMLKVHKEQMEESKKVYDNDIKLFNIFSENIINDNCFVLPELFVEKYNIIKKLKEEDKLSWENFSHLYKKENYYGDYFGINDYEEYFYKSKENDINNIEEELDIESSSDTDTSTN